MLVNPESLAETIISVADAYLHKRTLSDTKKLDAARWIADRQHMDDAYRPYMFAPTFADITNGARTVTGERLTSRAGIRHILGEEACRALILLASDDRCVQDALQSSIANMKWLHSDGPEASLGWYCCCTCSVSLWRLVAVSNLPNREQHLDIGMERLREHRGDDGRWKSFPFYYTLSALIDIDRKQATDELRHAGYRCERGLVGLHGGDVAIRRRIIVEKALERC
jgi:hypothetical protein